jgi:hypothetical protein
LIVEGEAGLTTCVPSRSSSPSGCGHYSLSAAGLYLASVTILIKHSDLNHLSS